MRREKFSSRLGFLLISAGCAIGLGNVWRFPYVVGKYGGAAFVLLYLLFLFLLGLPIMVMEYAVGRASQRSIARSFDELEPPGTKWHWHKAAGMAGNYLLMMFYTTIAGWLLLYLLKTAAGGFEGLNTEGVPAVFNDLLAQPVPMPLAMTAVVVLCFGICSCGLRNGVERVTKWMMLCLLAIMAVLAVRACFLPHAADGLRFYLYPDFERLAENGLFNAIFDAMGQAFFPLSVGIGSIAVFGSYIGRKYTLAGEAVRVTLLDTGVALTAGLIIFPACFAYGISPDSGPNLLFVTLPNVFLSMPGGRFWGSLFFLFMSFAALSTVTAVFENLLSCCMELWNCSRRKAVLINLVLICGLSLPCVLGFNLLSRFHPLGGDSTILDLEDFLVSNNFLPLGSLVYLLFCVSRSGWGWERFLAEANAGKGLRFPSWLKGYVTTVLPVIILLVFIQGYLARFFPQLFL